MNADTVTFWAWISPWFILGLRELYVVVQRIRGVRVRTISMVAKDYGPHVTSAIYLWCSMPSHWWWNAKRWGPDWLAVVFWVIPVLALGWDVKCWREDPATWPRWKRLARHPLLWMVGAALAGRFLFPQAA